MAKRKGQENLIPTNRRSKEEARELGRKGGIASGEARRKAKTYREIARAINAAPVNLDIPGLAERLSLVGLDAEKETNAALVPATIFTGLLERDMKAVEMWRNLTEDEQSDNGAAFELPARALGRSFVDINRQIKPNIRYVFKGGRGGLKSSYISLKIVELLKNYPNLHACIVRKIGATLKDSVFAQMQWAIRELGLESQFRITKNPLEITLTATGQKIYFRGCDDPMKLKGIKPTFGYVGILWKEELDQLAGAAEERSVNQSTLRGGMDSFEFCSYNPPRSRSSWVNQAELEADRGKTVYHESCYLEAPVEWLGQKFIDDADFLKRTNPAAYENEYLGIANGDGGSVFENLEIREITDEEINTFWNIYQGLDFGWFPDPLHWSKSCYDSTRHILYVFDEFRANKMSNYDLWVTLTEQKGVTSDDLIIADSAEPKSIGDLRAYGANIRGAVKGADSRTYSHKWLQSLVKIIIDPVRCPATAKEFSEYEYERDKEGNVISGYPDGADHAIDSVIYSLNGVWKRRGQ